MLLSNSRMTKELTARKLVDAISQACRSSDITLSLGIRKYLAGHISLSDIHYLTGIGISVDELTRNLMKASYGGYMSLSDEELVEELNYCVANDIDCGVKYIMSAVSSEERDIILSYRY